MNSEEYQKLISLSMDGKISLDDAEKLQQYLQKYHESDDTQATFSQLEEIFSKPHYPFDTPNFVDKVMHEIRPQRRGIYRKMIAAILLIIAGIVGASITYFTVRQSHVTHEEPLAELQVYSAKENPWKLLQEAITCKIKNPAKAKYLFVEARNRTENSQVFDTASYQLAVMSYYKENKVLYALSQLCELAESIEINATHDSPYTAMSLHLAKEIYLSLSSQNVLRPIAKQVIKKFQDLSAENNREQPVIMIGDPYEK